MRMLPTNSSKEEAEPTEVKVEEPSPLPDETYRYFWRDDDQKTVYVNQDELKKTHPESCEPDKHTWTTTFTFALYDCVRCKARRETK